MIFKKQAEDEFKIKSVVSPEMDRELKCCAGIYACLLYTSPSPRDRTRSRMPSSA